MKIYDCFSYWDEDLLLELRLNILNEYVDYFVIIEGNKTWQNNFKELKFDIDKLEKSDIEEFKYYNVQEKYRLFLLPALMLIGLEMILKFTLFRSFI